MDSLHQGFTMRKIYLLISLLSLSFLLAQDPHVYWKFNTDPEPYDDDEYLNDFPSYDYGDACTENTDDGYYVCFSRVHEHNCSDDSRDDVAIIKINYDGQEFDRDYICDFDDFDNYDDST